MLGISHYTRKKDLSETENNSFISEKNTTHSKIHTKIVIQVGHCFLFF